MNAECATDVLLNSTTGDQVVALTACGADAELRAEVERLIRAQDQAGDFLAEPLLIAWPALVAAARSTAEAVIGKHLHEAPGSLRTVRPEVSQHVEEAVARALSKEAAGDRFASAGDLAAALGGSAAVPIEARSPRRLLAMLGRRRAALGDGLLALGAVGVAAEAADNATVVSAALT